MTPLLCLGRPERKSCRPSKRLCLKNERKMDCRRFSEMMKEWPPQYDRSYIPSPDSNFWFKDLETMDPEERERRMILPKLQAQLTYAYENSLLYKKKWD